ncbi:uncharacterized protein [Musca autumnalis]|uniref:uncharacterized protein n=1 Tax=Musca autumnalis TaxID=221902 RepID=UPI003CF911B5
MDTAGGAVAAVPSIVAANQTTTNTATSSPALSSSPSSNVIINGNLSNGAGQHHLHHDQHHPHHQQHSSLIHSNIISSGSNSSSSTNSSSSGSLIIGHSSASSGGGSSNSSTSSNSSGYGSTSATPTNSYETHGTSTTPVAIAEPIIPAATVATVSPFYSEAITSQNHQQTHDSQVYSTQYQQHSATGQQHLHLQTQQQQQHQVVQQHSQTNLNLQQQQLQHSQRSQQYYTGYDYNQSFQQQESSLVTQQHQQSHLPQSHSHSPTAYGLGTAGSAGAFDSSPNSNLHTTPYPQQSMGHSYKATGPTSGISYDRQRSTSGHQTYQHESTTAAAAASAPTTAKHNQPFGQSSATSSSSKSRSSSSSLLSMPSTNNSTASVATTKPQAAATPFYAQPLAQSQPSGASAYYAELQKHKAPLDYHHDQFSNLASNASAYHQQQKYYAAAKSQLKEVTSYGSTPGKSLYHNANNFYPGAAAQHAGSSLLPPNPGYMYPTAAYPSSLGYEAAPVESVYRKTNAALNSSSWPWGMDYAGANSRGGTGAPPPPPSSAGHLPTATVAPTHASYLGTANSSHLTARDPYYMPADKYAMKYDKYAGVAPPPPPYQQNAYVSPPSSRHPTHHLWPGSSHNTLNDRLAVAAAPPPPHHVPHPGSMHGSSNPYYATNPATAIRQSCCPPAPYQTQNCYYPSGPPPPATGRITHGQPMANLGQIPPSYPAAQSLNSQQAHLNQPASKYAPSGGLEYPTSATANKLKNDLYMGSHYDPTTANTPQHLSHHHHPQHHRHPAVTSYQYGTASNQQLYPTSTNQMSHHPQAHHHHGQQPAGPLIAHEPLVNPNGPGYSNDLTYDSYLHETISSANTSNSAMGLGGAAAEMAATNYAVSAAKRALLDYRKPPAMQPPPQSDYYRSQESVPRGGNTQPSYGGHITGDLLLNTPETNTSFNEYPNASAGFAEDETSQLDNQNKSSTDDSTKNLSLRDFIANWNDDEDDYASTTNEDLMAFDQQPGTGVINEVLQSVSVDKEPDSPQVLNDKPQVVVKEPEVPQATTTSILTDDLDAQQYANLPDIIVDIEKSSGNGGTGATVAPNVNDNTSDLNSFPTADTELASKVNENTNSLATVSATVASSVGESNSSLSLDNFDVEKELDQLQQDSVIVKPSITNNQQISPGVAQDSKRNDATSVAEDRQVAFADLQLENSKSNTIPPAATAANTRPPADTDGYDSGCSRHSNESSLFEKEYETFINKISNNSDSLSKADKEIEQKVQDFSKFYKRKRKLRDEMEKKHDAEDGTSLQDNKKSRCATDGAISPKESNFPQVYTKKSRNRPPAIASNKPLPPRRRRKPSSFYYKAMQNIRRYPQHRSQMVRDFMADLKEKHLPLIKRQSIKNYSMQTSPEPCAELSPLPLKTLVLGVINSEDFRKRFVIQSVEQQMEDDAAVSDEKHICTDPSCETCEVIRSLMETEEAAPNLDADVVKLSDEDIIDLASSEEVIVAKEVEDLTDEGKVILIPEDTEEVLPAVYPIRVPTSNEEAIILEEDKMAADILENQLAEKEFRENQNSLFGGVIRKAVDVAVSGVESSTIQATENLQRPQDESLKASETEIIDQDQTTHSIEAIPTEEKSRDLELEPIPTPTSPVESETISSLPVESVSRSSLPKIAKFEDSHSAINCDISRSPPNKATATQDLCPETRKPVIQIAKPELNSEDTSRNSTNPISHLIDTPTGKEFFAETRNPVIKILNTEENSLDQCGAQRKSPEENELPCTKDSLNLKEITQTNRFLNTEPNSGEPIALDHSGAQRETPEEQELKSPKQIDSPRVTSVIRKIETKASDHDFEAKKMKCYEAQDVEPESPKAVVQTTVIRKAKSKVEENSNSSSPKPTTTETKSQPKIKEKPIKNPPIILRIKAQTTTVIRKHVTQPEGSTESSESASSYINKTFTVSKVSPNRSDDEESGSESEGNETDTDQSSNSSSSSSESSDEDEHRVKDGDESVSSSGSDSSDTDVDANENETLKTLRKVVEKCEKLSKIRNSPKDDMRVIGRKTMGCPKTKGMLKEFNIPPPPDFNESSKFGEEPDENVAAPENSKFCEKFDAEMISRLPEAQINSNCTEVSNENVDKNLKIPAIKIRRPTVTALSGCASPKSSCWSVENELQTPRTDEDQILACSSPRLRKSPIELCPDAAKVQDTILDNVRETEDDQISSNPCPKSPVEIDNSAYNLVENEGNQHSSNTPPQISKSSLQLHTAEDISTNSSPQIPESPLEPFPQQEQEPATPEQSFSECDKPLDLSRQLSPLQDVAYESRLSPNTVESIPEISDERDLQSSIPECSNRNEESLNTLSTENDQENLMRCDSCELEDDLPSKAQLDGEPLSTEDSNFDVVTRNTDLFPEQTTNNTQPDENVLTQFSTEENYKASEGVHSAVSKTISPVDEKALPESDIASSNDDIIELSDDSSSSSSSDDSDVEEDEDLNRNTANSENTTSQMENPTNIVDITEDSTSEEEFESDDEIVGEIISKPNTPANLNNMSENDTRSSVHSKNDDESVFVNDEETEFSSVAKTPEIPSEIMEETLKTSLGLTSRETEDSGKEAAAICLSPKSESNHETEKEHTNETHANSEHHPYAKSLEPNSLEGSRINEGMIKAPASKIALEVITQTPPNSANCIQSDSQKLFPKDENTEQIYETKVPQKAVEETPNQINQNSIKSSLPETPESPLAPQVEDVLSLYKTNENAIDSLEAAEVRQETPPIIESPITEIDKQIDIRDDSRSSFECSDHSHQVFPHVHENAKGPVFDLEERESVSIQSSSQNPPCKDEKEKEIVLYPENENSAQDTHSSSNQGEEVIPMGHDSTQCSETSYVKDHSANSQTKVELSDVLDLSKDCKSPEHKEVEFNSQLSPKDEEEKECVYDLPNCHTSPSYLKGSNLQTGEIDSDFLSQREENVSELSNSPTSPVNLKEIEAETEVIHSPTNPLETDSEFVSRGEEHLSELSNSPRSPVMLREIGVETEVIHSPTNPLETDSEFVSHGEEHLPELSNSPTSPANLKEIEAETESIHSPMNPLETDSEIVSHGEEHLPKLSNSPTSPVNLREIEAETDAINSNIISIDEKVAEEMLEKDETDSEFVSHREEHLPELSNSPTSPSNLKEIEVEKDTIISPITPIAEEMLEKEEKNAELVGCIPQSSMEPSTNSADCDPSVETPKSSANSADKDPDMENRKLNSVLSPATNSSDHEPDVKTHKFKIKQFLKPSMNNADDEFDLENDNLNSEQSAATDSTDHDNSIEALKFNRESIVEQLTNSPDEDLDVETPKLCSEQNASINIEQHESGKETPKFNRQPFVEQSINSADDDPDMENPKLDSEDIKTSANSSNHEANMEAATEKQNQSVCENTLEDNFKYHQRILLDVSSGSSEEPMPLDANSSGELGVETLTNSSDEAISPRENYPKKNGIETQESVNKLHSSKDDLENYQSSEEETSVHEVQRQNVGTDTQEVYLDSEKQLSSPLNPCDMSEGNRSSLLNESFTTEIAEKETIKDRVQFQDFEPSQETCHVTHSPQSPTLDAIPSTPIAGEEINEDGIQTQEADSVMASPQSPSLDEFPSSNFQDEERNCGETETQNSMASHEVSSVRDTPQSPSLEVSDFADEDSCEEDLGVKSEAPKATTPLVSDELALSNNGVSGQTVSLSDHTDEAQTSPLEVSDCADEDSCEKDLGVKSEAPKSTTPLVSDVLALSDNGVNGQTVSLSDHTDEAQTSPSDIAEVNNRSVEESENILHTTKERCESLPHQTEEILYSQDELTLEEKAKDNLSKVFEDSLSTQEESSASPKDIIFQNKNLPKEEEKGSNELSVDKPSSQVEEESVSNELAAETLPNQDTSSTAKMLASPKEIYTQSLEESKNLSCFEDEIGNQEAPKIVGEIPATESLEVAEESKKIEETVITPTEFPERTNTSNTELGAELITKASSEPKAVSVIEESVKDVKTPPMISTQSDEVPTNVPHTSEGLSANSEISLVNENLHVSDKSPHPVVKCLSKTEAAFEKSLDLSSKNVEQSASLPPISPKSPEYSNIHNCEPSPSNLKPLEEVLTRSSLPLRSREPSPEMNFWNTKGKCRVLRKRRGDISTSPSYVETRRYSLRKQKSGEREGNKEEDGVVGKVESNKVVLSTVNRKFSQPETENLDSTTLECDKVQSKIVGRSPKSIEVENTNLPSPKADDCVENHTLSTPGTIGAKSAQELPKTSLESENTPNKVTSAHVSNDFLGNREIEKSVSPNETPSANIFNCENIPNDIKTPSKNKSNSENRPKDFLGDREIDGVIYPTEVRKTSVDISISENTPNEVGTTAEAISKSENIPNELTSADVSNASLCDGEILSNSSPKQHQQTPSVDISNNEDTPNEIITPSDEISNTANIPNEANSIDASNDFLTFKYQTSFDEGSDFNGFEDPQEEELLRREVENLNEDSAANDAFKYAIYNKNPDKSPSKSSEFDELEALEKELSQQCQTQVDENIEAVTAHLHKVMGGGEDDDVDEEAGDIETEPPRVSVTNASISTNDIEHIKKMLESDEEPGAEEAENDTNPTQKYASVETETKENISSTNLCSIPKLSDLCRAALNSSLNINKLTIVQSNEVVVATETTCSEEENNNVAVPHVLVERELSVEEALAEMYRQAGVLLSDHEDNESDRASITTVAPNQDLLLINLHEILNSSDNDVYVLQCDVNVSDSNNNNNNDDQTGENNPNDVNESGPAVESQEIVLPTERFNTLQLIGIVNRDTDGSEIHIISSDSESEVIILSDCDTDVEFQPPPPPPKSFSPRPPHREYIPFITDYEDQSSDTMSDISTIHHEEVVPDNLNKFLQEEFFKYLHEKYAQKKLSKYYHANRVLRKYKKNRLLNKYRP